MPRERRPWTVKEIITVWDDWRLNERGHALPREDALWVAGLAERFGRTPASVRMLISNFVAADASDERKGLSGASALVRQVVTCLLVEEARRTSS